MRYFRDMTERIVAPGIPNVRQQWFSDQLFRRVGCRLAWHVRRKVFIVFRQTSEMSKPQTYPGELGSAHFPLSDEILDITVDAVRLSDAFASKDAMKALDVYNRRQNALAKEDSRKMIADRFPDFLDGMEWAQRVFDNGGSKRAVTPMITIP